MAILSCINKQENQNKCGPLHVQHPTEGEGTSRGVDFFSASVEVPKLTEYFEHDLKIIMIKQAHILKWCLWVFSQPSNTCLLADFANEEMSS